MRFISFYKGSNNIRKNLKKRDWDHIFFKRPLLHIKNIQESLKYNSLNTNTTSKVFLIDCK